MIRETNQFTDNKGSEYNDTLYKGFDLTYTDTYRSL